MGAWWFYGEGLTSEGVRLRRGYIIQQAQIPDLRSSLYKYESSSSTAFTGLQALGHNNN